jgi:hypothetical protein
VHLFICQYNPQSPPLLALINECTIFFFPTNTASHNQHACFNHTYMFSASSMFMTSHLRSCSVQVEFALRACCALSLLSLCPHLLSFLAKCSALLALFDRVDVFAYLFHCCFAFSNTCCLTILPGATYYPVPSYHATQTASDTVHFLINRFDLPCHIVTSRAMEVTRPT